MPKETYFHLSKEKQQRIYEVCKQEFETHSFYEAKVSHIVKALGISRGSFYLYFEDLQDCYFYILQKETCELHDLFMQLMDHEDVVNALRKYQDVLLAHLLDPSVKRLYETRFLYWGHDLNQAWKAYQVTSSTFSPMPSDFIHYLKAVIHDLVFRLYSEGWDAETFKQHYQTVMHYVLYGISHRKEHAHEHHQ
ncbi:TetR/AcrR family transcriptional regulator [Erysipelotrichaceae bacterium OH741_COT-311]|nr:TetR/AcrR family transcriptional regulator [Erysipelotrichaceae bacterium OH741_COT-311]